MEPACGVFAEHFPSTSVVVQPKQSNATLDMVVDEDVINFGKGFIQSFGHEAVSDNKLEINT